MFDRILAVAMLNLLTMFLAKNEFLSERGDIYAQLHSNFAEEGSGKISTARELFQAWGIRTASRRANIALIHKAIVVRLDRGYSFSQALAPFVPAEETMTLEAGEAAGNLLAALESVQVQKASGEKINSLVVAAMAEPAMSALSIAATSWFCGLYLWPELLKTVSEKYWPEWSLPLIRFEVFFAAHWQMLVLVVLIAALYWWSIPRWTGRMRNVFDKIPPWSTYRLRQAAALLVVLGALLNAGMELDAALARIEKGSAPWLAWHIRNIRKRLLTAGHDPITCLNTGLFETSMMDMIEDAARNRSFDATLLHLGTDAMPLIVDKVKKLAVITGTVFTLFTGSLFMYQVAVQQSAVNTATNNFSAAQSK